MKKFLSVFFTTLGVIFFLILIALAIFITLDPYHIRPLIFGTKTQSETAVSTKPKTTTATVSDKNPILSDTQEKALEKVGIDPASVPSSITPEQEACFVSKLGQKRVDEIVAGDSPTTFEILSSAGCIN